MEVRLERVPGMRVAYATYEGPLDRVGGIFHRIQGWVMRQGETPEPIIGVFREQHQPTDEHGQPHGASVGTAEAWIPFDKHPDPEIDERFPSEIPVAVKDVPGVDVASVHYAGPPLELLRLQDQLRAYLTEQGFTLAAETRHVYLVMDPDDHDKWQTLLQVPYTAPPRPL